MKLESSENSNRSLDTMEKVKAELYAVKVRNLHLVIPATEEQKSMVLFFFVIEKLG